MSGDIIYSFTPSHPNGPAPVPFQESSLRPTCLPPVRQTSTYFTSNPATLTATPPSSSSLVVAAVVPPPSTVITAPLATASPTLNPPPKPKSATAKKVPPKEKKTATHGRPIGVGNWNDATLAVLCDLAASYLPRTPANWERIAVEFNQKFGTQKSSKALKEKFNRLVKGAPTGGGGPGPFQVRARQIMTDINNSEHARVTADYDEDNEDDIPDDDVNAWEAEGYEYPNASARTGQKTLALLRGTATPSTSTSSALTTTSTAEDAPESPLKRRRGGNQQILRTIAHNQSEALNMLQRSMEARQAFQTRLLETLALKL